MKKQFSRIFLSLFILLLTALTLAQRLPVPNMLDTASPNAREIAGLFWWVMGFSVFVLLVVVVFLGAAIIRGYRERNMTEEPPQIHGHLGLEITWTVLPLLILGVLLVLTIGSIYRLDGFASPKDALEVDVLGQQFWWEMSYPDEGIITANELVLPAGRPVKLNLSSKDVIHSFWVPQLAGKTDLVPGEPRTMWFTPEEEGIFYGQCAELCGASHANMRLRVLVLAPAEYDAWVAASKQPPAAPSETLALEGQQLFSSKGCVGCHAVNGLNTYNRTGPDLSYIGSRTTIAAGTLENNRENMVRWLRFTDTVKPGVLMPNLGLSQQEAEALAAYLEGLRLPGVDLEDMIGASSSDTRDDTETLETSYQGVNQ